MSRKTSLLITHSGYCDHRERRVITTVTQWFLSAIFLIAPCNLPGWAASSDAFLDAPMDKFEAPWGQELYELCSSLNRPCGKENALGMKLGQGPDLNLKKTKAREILDAITRRFPGYHWVIRDDVLILEPEHRTGKDLLARKLGYVSIHGSSSYKAARTVFEQAGIHLAELHGGTRSPYARIDLELRNVTVREALNAIAKADGQAMWLFGPRDVEKYIGGFSLASWRRSGVSDFDEEIDSCPPIRKWLIRLRLKWNILLPVSFAPCHEK